MPKTHKFYIGFEVLIAVIMESFGFLIGLLFSPGMEVIFFSETSSDFQQNTQRCIPEGKTLHKFYG
jgi:hypothetical protein